MIKTYIRTALTISILYLFMDTLSQGQSWTQLNPSGNIPLTRQDHTAVYDSTNNKMIIFGGINATSNYRNDLWILNNANGLDSTTSTWTQLIPSGISPSTRGGHTAVYDATNNRMIIFGGVHEGGVLNDVWVLSNANGLDTITATWTQLVPTGSTPFVRAGHSSVYDAINNRIIIFGGSSGWVIYYNDVWVLSNANGLGGTPAWTQLAPTGSIMTAREGHTAVYDATNNRMIIFGGGNISQYGITFNDIWLLSNANGLDSTTSSWTQLFPFGSSPAPRIGHTTDYNTTNNRMIIFGGDNGNDVWVLSNSNGLGGTPIWTQLAPTGSNLTTRTIHSSVYDIINDRMIIFGGFYYNTTNSYRTNLNDVWVLSSANRIEPSLGNIPSLKLFVNQSLISALDLADYNIGVAATSYSFVSSFLGLSSVTGSLVYQQPFASITSGSNMYEAINAYGSSTTNNKVKYSTYKIKKLPQVVMRPGGTWNVNVGRYTIDSSHNNVIPPSFNQSDSLVVSDTSQLNASWSDISTVSITALAGFGNAQYVDVIASPFATAPYGVDIDKERIEIYPAISTTALEFSNSSDTGVSGYQIPAGSSVLATVGYSTGVSDSSGAPSHGGTLMVTFNSASDGIKITPQFSTWLPNTPQSWYTLRVRVMGTSTTNSYLQLLYNGNPGVSPTDVQGYYKYSMTTVWTYFDIPVNSYSPISSANVMYPQIVLKANGGTGTVYIDEMEIFQATPPLIKSRCIASTKYEGGYWNDNSATTKWGMQVLSGSPSISILNGQLQITTSGTSTSQTGVKYTASTSAGKVYTVGANIGRQVGMEMQTNFVSGTPSLTLTQAQVNLLGAAGPGSGTQDGDIGAAAEIGRISPRTLRLAFNAKNPYYQVQFIVKSTGNSTIQIDNTQADVDNDDPNYGDGSLYP